MPPALPILPYLSSGNSSALTRKFGPETANYFSGSPLNRLSWLRGDHLFLRAAFSHPTAKFLLMNGLGPLVESGQNGEQGEQRLGFVGVEDVQPLQGEVEEVFKSEEEVVAGYDSEEVWGKKGGERVVVFLGVDLHDVSGETAKGGVFEWKEFKGTPYFAVDVTPREGDGQEQKKKAEELVKKMEQEKG